MFYYFKGVKTVKNSDKKQKLDCLDGIKREVTKDHLLICDDKKALAIAGIMGLENSCVTIDTTDILIESAYFDPVTIRKGSKLLDLSTDASKRFERDTDIDNVIYSLDALAALVQKIADGEICKDLIDVYPKPKSTIQIDFNIDDCNSLLGTSIDKKDIFMDESIKSIGNHYVTIHLGEDLDPKVKIKVKSETLITYRIHTGEIIRADVIAIDPVSDLCALSATKIYAAPVRVARGMPNVGDRVFVMSAPYGINAPKMTLIFSGYYSGRDSETHFYTIPTRPGSSGSVILNSRFRAIGVTSAAFSDIESIGMGSGHEELSRFLDDIVESTQE